MARFSHLPLYIKTYEFLKTIYRITKQFPKEFKYTLGTELQKIVWEMLDTIIEANSQPDPEKKPYIQKISILFDKFKIRFRFAYEINLLTSKKFEFCQRELEEIGKMISGWLKWAERQRITPPPNLIRPYKTLLRTKSKIRLQRPVLCQI